MPLPKFLLFLGILMTAGGVTGTGILYRDMKIENLKHAKTDDLPVALGAPSPWKGARFTLFRSGSHMLFLTLENTERGAPARARRFQGRVEIEISSPDGTPHLKRSIEPEDPAVCIPDSVATIPLGSFEVAEPTELPWEVRVRVAAPDSAFSRVRAGLFVLPPQVYEIGSYLSTKIYILIGLGITAVAGFVMIVLSSALQQRANAPRRPTA